MDYVNAQQYILAFKAGRAIRRDGTNFVDPKPEKGAVILYDGEDDLLHFVWKDRTTGNVGEDLIMFEGDASFTRVSNAPGGRTYVLKFQSSDQRHFFWMQDASPERDADFVRNLNGRLQDPAFSLTWNTETTPAASSSTSGPSRPIQQATPEQVEALRRLLSSYRAGGAAVGAAPPEYSLTDILTPANITPLFTSHPELVPTLFPHLPSDLPNPPTAETVIQIIASAQFRSAASNLDQALRTGLLGDFVRSLGLPEEAGASVEAFLKAIQDQAASEDTMETD